jgi:uncharacterized protein (DUF58 family)
MKTCFSLLSIALCVVFASPCYAAQDWSIAISVPSNTVSVGEDIRLDIQFTNESNKQLKTAVSMPAEPGVDVIVLSQNGAAVPKTAYGRTIYEGTEEVRTQGSVARATILPGAHFDEVSVLNDVYDMSVPGVYTVQVKSHDNDPKNIVASNTISVTVQN